MGWDFKNCLDQCKSSGKWIAQGYFSSGPISKTVLALFKIGANIVCIRIGTISWCGK